MNGHDSAEPLHNAALKAIEAKLGRPLRVLHIGNIANNAYNNARIQRQYGIEADVLCYDYYHIMATPEWEDAEFEGEVDADAPDWWSTSLKGWRRPDWFVQGPAEACIQYLKARNLGLNRLAKLLWTFLEARCLNHVRHFQRAMNRPMTALGRNHNDTILIVEWLGLDKVPAHEASASQGPAPRSATTAAQAALATGGPGPARHKDSRLRALLRPAVRGAIALYYFAKASLVRMGRYARHRATRHPVDPPIASHLLEASQPVEALVVPYLLEARQLSDWRDDAALAERDRIFAQRVKRLMADEDSLAAKDREQLENYVAAHPRRFFRILRDYDVVQLYSVDGFIAAMNGLEHYCAYEHGTLRDLPFGNDFYGALTRCAYAHATSVFVTNSDVLPSVDRMGLDPARVICLPHAFDDRKLMRFLAVNPGLAPPPGPAVIFSPTRHHWNDRSGSWTKGNDVLFRAAALVAAEGHDFRLHLVEWGKEVAESKALLAELGLSGRVVWLPTMKKRELWEAYCTAHAVADQFMLPALGGVGFETMTLGRRLITAIDETQLSHFFGEPPPCLVASDVEQCAVQLRLVVADPFDEAGRGMAAQQWMCNHHSADRIVDIQARAYQHIIDEMIP
jgi:glycosyltransferase involved in cell wall biosynthesis